MQILCRDSFYSDKACVKMCKLIGSRLMLLQRYLKGRFIRGLAIIFVYRSGERAEKAFHSLSYLFYYVTNRSS